MENKFEDELSKIEKLLNKVDTDLSTDNMKTDFSTFFKNVDKTFEIYNICLEELCGQLYLLDLSSHSKIFRKLYHHYKHQLYNIMKYQLNLQKELNDKSEDEKNYMAKIDTLSTKLKTMKDKKLKLHGQLEEQKLKIEKLIITNAQQRDSKRVTKLASVEKERNLYNINFENDGDIDQTKEELNANSIKRSVNDDLLNQADNLLQENDDSNTDPRLKQNLIKLLAEIETQKKKLAELRKETDLVAKKNQEAKGPVSKINKSKFSEAPVSKKNGEIMTSTVLYTSDEFEMIKRESDQYKSKCSKLREDLEQLSASNQKRVAELNATIVELEEEMSSLKEGVEYMDSLNKEQKNEVHNFEIKEEGFNIHLQNIQNELEEYRREYNENTEKIKHLEDINDTLREELEKRDQVFREATQSIDQLQELQGEKQELAKMLGDLEERELKRQSSSDDDVKQLLDNKSKKIEILEKEINRLIKANKDLTKQLSDELEAKRSIQENFEQLGEKYKTALKQIEVLKKILNQVQKSMVDDQMDLLRSNTGTNKNLPNVDSKASNLDKNQDNKDGNKSNKNLNRINRHPEKSSMNKESLRNLVKGNQDKNSEINTNNQDKLLSQDALNKNNTKSDPNDKIGTPTGRNNHANIELEHEPSVYDETKDLQEDRFKNSESAEDEDSDFEDDPKKSNIQRLMKFLGKENFTRFSKEHNIDENNLNMDDYLKALMNDEEQHVNVVQVTCNRSIQCDYMSVVDYIRENKDLVVYYENDFEKIKEAIDVLTEIIGFSDVDEAGDNLPDSILEGTIKMANTAEQKMKAMSSIKAKHNENRMMQTFEKKDKKFQIKSKPKDQVTKLDKSKLNYEAEGNDEFDNGREARRVKNLSKNQVQKFKEKMQNTKPNETVVKKDIIHLEDSNEEDELNGDYVVQKNRIVASDGVNNKYEIVEFVRIPKQLKINKATLNPHAAKSTLKKIYTFEHKVLTQYEKQQREKEKVYFRIYINLKKRYQHRPFDFIKIYKVYFNQVPDFSERADEDYDPEAFLFSFTEFKEHFVQLLYIHQSCGANCIHLKRFYEKALTFDYSNKQLVKLSNQLIDKVPEILSGRM